MSQRGAIPMRSIEMDLFRSKVEKAFVPPTLFLPFIGEYGCMIMFHTRFVHTHPAERKIVCCRHGEEPYFPSATAFEYDWDYELPDKKRAGINERVQADPAWSALVNRLARKHDALPVFSQYRNDFHVKVPVRPRRRRGLRVDVVLAPRARQFCTERNFNRWEELAAAIALNGYSVGCIGKEDVSLRLGASTLNSWDCPDPTDAMLEMLLNCRAYVGTDTGPTHLAGLMDVPMVLFGNFGYMWAAQAASRAPWVEIPDGWNYPEDVVDGLNRFLKTASPVNPIVTGKPDPKLGFDHVFYLNLDRRPDRKAWMEHQLLLSGVEAERFPAVSVDEKGAFTHRGQRGCLLSHRGMVQLAVDRGYRHVLILEDDARFVDRDRFAAVAARIARELHRQEWDLFYFQHNGEVVLKDFRTIRQTAGSWLTHAVAVHSRFYRRYLELADEALGRPIDAVLHDSDARVFASREDWVVQRFPEDTDIDRGIKRPPVLV